MLTGKPHDLHGKIPMVSNVTFPILRFSQNQSIDLDMALEHWRLRNTPVKHQQMVR